LKIKRRDILLAALVVVISLVFLREQGIVNIYMYRSKATTRRTALLARQGRPAWPTTVVINWDDDSQKGIRPDEKNALTVNISEFKISGNSWLPFRKSTEVCYRAKFCSHDKTIEGEISGKVQICVSGICSHCELVRLLRRQIENQIHGYLRQQRTAE